jgi:DNA-binding CsgD family transcriptional regulator
MDGSKGEQASIFKFARLTEKEREALRLVHRRLTSKEIAPLLGIQPDAVDARITSATRKLGVSDRGKAAVWLAEHEGPPPYQRLVYQSPEVAADQGDGILGVPTGDVAREVQKPFIVEELLAAAEANASAPSEGEKRNRLGHWQRVAIIAAIAFGTIVAAGVLVSALNGLVQLALTRRQLF